MSRNFLGHKLQKSLPSCTCSTPQPSKWLEGHCLTCLRTLSTPKYNPSTASRTPSPQLKASSISLKPGPFLLRNLNSVSNSISHCSRTSILKDHEVSSFYGNSYSKLHVEKPAVKQEGEKSPVSHYKSRCSNYSYNGYQPGYFNIKEPSAIHRSKSIYERYEERPQSMMRRKPESPYISRSTPKNIKNHSKMHSASRKTPEISKSQKYFRISSSRYPVPELRLPPRPQISIDERSALDSLSTSRRQRYLDGNDRLFTIKYIFKGHANSVNCIVPTTSKIWSAGHDYRLMAWETTTQFNRWRISPVVSIKGHSRPIRCIDKISENIIVTGGKDNKIKFWNDTEEVNCTGIIRNLQGGVNSITVASPITLLSASGGTGITLWDIESRTPAKQYSGHYKSVNSLILHKQSTFLSGGQDSTVRLWDMRLSRSVASFTEHNGPVKSLLIWDDNSFYSYGDDNGILKWDIRTCAVVQCYKEEGGCMVNVGGKLVTAGRDLKVWENRAFNVFEFYRETVKSLVFDDVEGLLYVGSMEGNITVLRPNF